MVDGELAAGRPVVAHVVWGKGNDHWVVIVGRWSDTTTAKRWKSNALWKYPTSEFQTVTGSTGHYKASWGDWLIRDPNKSSADPKGQEQRLFGDDAQSRGLSQPKKSSHYAIVGLFAVRRS